MVFPQFSTWGPLPKHGFARKRRYEGAFISKLSDAEGEAAETQVWLEFAVKCKYMKRDEAAVLIHRLR